MYTIYPWFMPPNDLTLPLSYDYILYFLRMGFVKDDKYYRLVDEHLFSKSLVWVGDYDTNSSSIPSNYLFDSETYRIIQNYYDIDGLPLRTYRVSSYSVDDLVNKRMECGEDSYYNPKYLLALEGEVIESPDLYFSIDIMPYSLIIKEQQPFYSYKYNDVVNWMDNLSLNVKYNQIESYGLIREGRMLFIADSISDKILHKLCKEYFIIKYYNIR
jgi:hypothetical protein